MLVLGGIIAARAREGLTGLELRSVAAPRNVVEDPFTGTVGITVKLLKVASDPCKNTVATKRTR